MKGRTAQELMEIVDYADARHEDAVRGTPIEELWLEAYVCAILVLNKVDPGLIPDPPTPLAMQPLVEAHDHLDLTY